ncbi:MAG TPA: SDR family NAD(P)-dependent oxidoreductase, partial [Bryobacteraceae bacterium]
AGDGIAFLFSGQGSQYAGMGAQLQERFVEFREPFGRCAAVFTECDAAHRSLEALVAGGLGSDADPLIVSPAIFALEYALARLWISLGIAPAALVGHSLGEYAAACVAGCFEPEEGMRLVMARASLIASIGASGAMAAVAAGVSVVRDLLKLENLTALSVAAINSPATTVISGATDVLDRALAAFAAHRIATRRLNTSQAFHSALMDEILDRFETVAASVLYRAPRIPLISNVTGEALASAPTPAYWRRHLRECVRFSDSVSQLQRRGISVFLETGPGDSLSSLVRRCDANCVAIPSIVRSQKEALTLLRAAGRMYTLGANFDWSALYPEGGRWRGPDLPGHPFHSKSYWFSDVVAGDVSSEEPPPAAVPEVHHSGWLYDVRWIRLDPPEEAASKLEDDEARHWIIVGDGGGLATELATRLGRGKREVFRVSYDAAVERGVRRTTDRKSGVTRFSVRPGCSTDIYGEVLSEIMTRLSRADTERWNILYLRPLDCMDPERTSIESLERDQDLCSTADLMALAQALTRMVALKRLWVATVNAQAVPADGVDAVVRLAQTPVWGFAHTLFLEHPEMRGSLTDLAASDSPAEQARQLLISVAASDGESQAAFRGGVRYVPRLTPVASSTSTSEPLALRRDGAYLITGGLGGLGLRSALWMAERGAGHIVLLARRGLADRAAWDAAAAGSEERRKIDMILAIERAGASVEVLVLDVTDHAGVAEELRRIESGPRRLRGIVHAAGVNWFAKVDELDRARLLDALKIKISAAWNLHQLTRELELDFFVTYSSVSALWGSVNLSHYTAANHFLDALAWRRRREGLPALSIDWGPWSEVGMSAGREEARTLARLGLQLMPPGRAIQAMEYLVKTGATQAMVADIDWRTFQAFVNFSATPPFFGRVSAQPVAVAAQSGGSKAEAERIRKLPPEKARAELLSLLKQHLAAVLLLEPDREIDIQQRFNLMGMDSLMAIAFALRLEALAGARLPTTLAWNYPTLLDVANYLSDLIRGQDSTSGTPRMAPVLKSPGAENWFPGLAGADGSTPRIFCFPYAGAGASVYRDWKAALAGAAHVVPVQLPGREERAAQPPLRNIRELAARLADAFESIDPAPFAFFGHSMGALIAFEVSRELRRRGLPLPLRLILSACPAPEPGRRGEIHRLPDDEFRDHLMREFAGPQTLAGDEALWRALLPLLRADIALMEDFAIGDEAPLSIPVAVYGGRDDATAPRERLLGWSALTSGDFAIRLFAGGHMYIRDSAPLFDALRDEIGRIAVPERAAVSA